MRLRRSSRSFSPSAAARLPSLLAFTRCCIHISLAMLFTPRSGEEWLVNQGYPGFLEKRSTCVGVLIFFIIAYRFVAFLGVRFIKF